jgi:exosortase A
MSVQSTPFKADVSAARGRWVWHLSALAAVIAAILAAFWYEASNAVVVWWQYPTYSHCFLIIPIALWLAWNKRSDLAGVTPKAAPVVLLALVPVLLAWFAGYFVMINELRQFAVIGMIEVAIFALFGPGVFRILAFPALYLFFLVPFGEYLIPPMQQFATAFTDRALTLLGIVHYTEGTIIELPNARFEIAEACAGLRFLIATLALGVLFVHLTYRKWWKVWTFLAACVVVPLIANGLRCVGIVTLAYLTNNAKAVEADHVMYGLGFNVAILFVLLLGGIRFRDTPVSVPARSSDTSPVSARSQVRVIAVAAALVAILGSIPALAHWQEDGAGQTVTHMAAPISVAGWTKLARSADWRPDYFAPDRKLETSIARNAARSARVDLAVWYYARVSPSRSLMSPSNHVWQAPVWGFVDSDRQSGQIGMLPVQFTETILSSPAGRRVVWSCYWIDDRFSASTNLVKLLELKTALIGPHGAALIALSTPVTLSLEEARDRLRSAAHAFTTLPALLEHGVPGTTLSSAR